MRVHLRRGNIGMTKNRLNRAQVGAIFHHMGGATMTKHMRARPSARNPRSHLHHLPDSLSGKCLATISHEEQWRVFASGNDRPRLPQIFLEAFQCGSTDRRDTFLVALSVDKKVTHVEFEVFKFCIHNFCSPQPTGVEQLQHRLVANRDSLVELASPDMALVSYWNLHCLLCQRLWHHSPLLG